MTSEIVIIDLYSGPGGVGLSLSRISEAFDLSFTFVGVDRTDYSDTYPGDFIQLDASAIGELINALWYYLTDYEVVVLWMSPPCLAYTCISYSNASRFGFDDPREYYPTFDDLNVRAVVDAIDPDHYIIENVATCEELEDPTRINGFGVGKPYDLERHFETTFACPDLLDEGEIEAGLLTRTGDWQSKKPLARTKNVPETWDRQEIRSAIPREMVQYLLHYCPAVDRIPLPEAAEPRQHRFGEVIMCR